MKITTTEKIKQLAFISGIKELHRHFHQRTRVTEQEGQRPEVEMNPKNKKRPERVQLSQQEMEV